MLNLKDTPILLCDMICNMLDTIHGDLRGDESYHHVADVREDLKLVLFKPFKYLQNENIKMLSGSGLKLPNFFYGQSEELKSLQKCFNHSYI